MSLNAYTGWGISTALLWLINKRSSKDTSSQQDPSNLSVNSSATKIGSPIPIILGRGIIKEPLISYFGDFAYAPYTETYSAHAQFDGKSLVINLILAVIASAFTTIMVTPPIVSADGANEGGPVHSTGTATGGTFKDIVTPALILTLFNWLLYWLINGRNLKTTIQKGFKYYLGWQHLVCWSGKNAQIKRVYMDENKIYEAGGVRHTKSKIVCVGEQLTLGVSTPEETLVNYPTALQSLMSNNFVSSVRTTNFISDVTNIISSNPSCIVLQYGAEEINLGKSVDDLVGDYTTIIDACINNKIIPYICSIQAYVNGLNMSPLHTIFNQKVRELCVEKKVPFIDIASPFYLEGGIDPQYIADDKIHLNNKGYAKLADLVYVGLLQNGYYDNKTIIVDINEPELFGGADEGGGFIGQLRLYLGGRFQQKDSWMIQQMSLPTVQEEVRGLTPIYKNFITVVVPKSYIGKQSSIPSMWFEITNYPCNLGFKPIGEDLNPAEALFEIITNTEWGCKEQPENIDLEMLVKLGTVCEEESLGISIKIDQTTPAKDVVNNILDLINAVKYADTATGKLIFKLIRNDYKEDELLILNQSNCEQLEFNRLDWSETVSNIAVEYIEPNNKYENGTVTYRDMANPLITGTKTEKKLDGSFFTTPTNALAYAQRESISQGYPLASVSIVANREAGKLTIGDPFIVNWLPYGIAKMVMRVTDIDYGSLTDGRIKIEALEDVFGFGRTKFEYGDGIQWTKPELLPKDIIYKKFFEVPFEMQHSLDTYVDVVATQPSQYTVGYSVWRLINNEFKVSMKTTNWTPTGRLVYGYSADTPFIDKLGFEIKEVGMYGYIEKLMETINADTNDVFNNRAGTLLMQIDDELMSFDNITRLPNGNYMVKGVIRGIYDTVVRPHTAEAVAFFLTNPTSINGTNRIARKGEVKEENLNITTYSVDKETEFKLGDNITLITTRRSEQPSVMSNLTVAQDRGSFTTFLKTFNASLGGDIYFKFNMRDKFKVSSVLSQDEASYRGQVIEVDDSIKNVLIINSNGNKVERMYNGKEIPIKYTWNDYCKDFNTPLQKDVSFEILTFDTVTGLYSYDRHYTNMVSYVIPTITGMFLSEPELETFLMSCCNNDGFLVPKTDYSPQSLIPYTLCSLVCVGVEDVNGVFAQDGKKYNISKCYKIQGKNRAVIKEEYPLLDGTYFESAYGEDFGNTKHYYKINNQTIQEVNLI